MHNPKYRWIICPCCEGNGKVDNPAFSNGITQSERIEMGEDFDTYMSGAYDVPCTDCNSTGKVQVPNIDMMTFAEKRVLAEQRRQARWKAEAARIEAMERRMGY